MEVTNLPDNEPEIIDNLYKKVIENYETKEKEIGEENIREFERVVMLKVVDPEMDGSH